MNLRARRPPPLSAQGPTLRLLPTGLTTTIRAEPSFDSTFSLLAEPRHFVPDDFGNPPRREIKPPDEQSNSQVAGISRSKRRCKPRPRGEWSARRRRLVPPPVLHTPSRSIPRVDEPLPSPGTDRRARMLGIEWLVPARLLHLRLGHWLANPLAFSITVASAVAIRAELSSAHATWACKDRSTDSQCSRTRIGAEPPRVSRLATS